MTQSNLPIKGVSVFLITNVQVFNPIILLALIHSGMEKVNAKRKGAGHVTTLHPLMGEQPVLALGSRLWSVRLQV